MPDTYRSVIDDDIVVGHVAMENVFFKMLDESALGNTEQKSPPVVTCSVNVMNYT